MKEELISLAEREFILNALSDRKRVDGREALDYRSLCIEIGAEIGCVCVHLGATKILVQVSCSVTTPKETRPTDGILDCYVEFSPMAGMQFETGVRPTVEVVEVNRLLERCLRESRAVDLESLCIAAGLKVWRIRVDLRVLEHAGGVIDACSIAAITALAHFRRPDVTVCGTDVTSMRLRTSSWSFMPYCGTLVVHSEDDHDPIPLSIHHMPLCVTIAFYCQGKYLLVDPTDREEQVMEGRLIVAMNKHREICLIQATGSMLLQREQVTRCTNMAAVKVAEFTERIQLALETDARARRTKGAVVGFSVLNKSLLGSGSLRQHVAASNGRQETGPNSGGVLEANMVDESERAKTVAASTTGGADMIIGACRSSPALSSLSSAKDADDTDIVKLGKISKTHALDVDAEKRQKMMTDVWNVDSSSDDDNNLDDSDVRIVERPQNAALTSNIRTKGKAGFAARTKLKGRETKAAPVIDVSVDDDEEEDVVIVQPDDFGFKKN